MEWSVIYGQLTSLRATLGQNLKTKSHTKSGQGTDELFTPSWIFFKHLQFLVPVMEARQSRDTLKKTEADNEVKDGTPQKSRQSNKLKDLEKNKTYFNARVHKCDASSFKYLILTLRGKYLWKVCCSEIDVL